VTPSHKIRGYGDFERWQRLEPKRQGLMKAALQQAGGSRLRLIKRNHERIRISGRRPKLVRHGAIIVARSQNLSILILNIIRADVEKDSN
jgi:hypothetical protein